MHGGDASGAFLTEATFDITPRHALFGRVETVDNEELLAAPDPLAGRNLIVAKATIGYGVKPAIQCSSQRRRNRLLDLPTVGADVPCHSRAACTMHLAFGQH